MHGAEVASQSTDEINRFYASGTATPAEHEFFDQVLATYQQNNTADPAISKAFHQHTHDIEHVYHTDQAGGFVELWPELTHLCK